MKPLIICIACTVLLPGLAWAENGSTGLSTTAWVLIWVFAALLTLFLLLRIFATPLLAIPYSLFLALFIGRKSYSAPEEHFEECRLLKENYQQIAEELRALMAAETPIPPLEQVDKVQGLFSRRDGIPWRTFFMKAYGNWVPGNCSKVPFTYGLLKEIPQVTTVMFSVMEPGKHIPGHRGIFNGILRYHLGLIVPEEGSSYLEVKGKRYAWREGEHIMFNDTHYHEAWNNASQARAILLLDIRREKSLPAWLRPINRRVISFFSKIKRVRAAVKNAEMKTEAPAVLQTN